MSRMRSPANARVSRPSDKQFPDPELLIDKLTSLEKNIIQIFFFCLPALGSRRLAFKIINFCQPTNNKNTGLALVNLRTIQPSEF